MHIGEIVGGVALVGVAVLVGIALIDDDAPELITADTSPFVFDTAAATSTSTSTSSSTVPPVASTPRTTAPVRTRASSPTSTAAPTSAEPAAPTTTLIPPEQRSGIAVRVLNGGAPALAATNTSATLRDARLRAGWARQRSAAGPGHPSDLRPRTRGRRGDGQRGHQGPSRERGPGQRSTTRTGRSSAAVSPCWSCSDRQEPDQLTCSSDRRRRGGANRIRPSADPPVADHRHRRVHRRGVRLHRHRPRSPSRSRAPTRPRTRCS